MVRYAKIFIISASYHQLYCKPGYRYVLLCLSLSLWHLFAANGAALVDDAIFSMHIFRRLFVIY